ncbi:DUF779 domain-containing protein [Calidifontibacter sp. DB0510]|uniref:DUF779 domain-containing protein n=1 Tax=Metallococcus carri TaxID=1656884 RepID=A0A967B6T5_9MICO|nr:DUF779 domain-containing protein [Metallococcus carri]NHN56622.1 DUF779 domain-containing protein [Metallococcus carri]NOP38921.1 DUF779 domain-containing protein [Calidifontibacter sp. DB2511S]
MTEVERVGYTEAAAELIRRLVERNGPVMFHQSGGCCDGSAPMCYPDGDFLIGDVDVLLQELRIDGVVEPVPFYMSESQFEYWKHTHLTLDVVPGRGSGFSLEAPEGVRFLIRSRVFDEAELTALGLL